MKIKEVEELISFIAKSGLEEVKIETDQIKLAVKRTASVMQQASSETHGFPCMPMMATQGASKVSDETEDRPINGTYVEIKAPMIGTFYQAPNPDASPFVRVGDRIQKGQKICVIEAMKLFNEIEADVSGTIVEVLLEDASPVEYDQSLFLVDPA